MIYVLLLPAATAVWGWTFVLVYDALTQYPTLPFLQIRLVVHRLPSGRELRVRGVIGTMLAAGYLTHLGAALVLGAIVGHEVASLKFEAHGRPSPP